MPKARRRRRSRRGRDLPLLIGVAAASLLIGYLLGVGSGGWRGEGPESVDSPAPAAGSEEPGDERVAVGAPPRAISPPAGETAPEPAPRRAPEPEPPAGGGARVAVVIDDLGRRIQDVADLAALGVALSYGVLPFESHTAEVVEELKRRDQEILLHLPMEPLSGANPGPGALTAKMSAAEIGAATRWALSAVAGATGVNNHMGSELTANRRTMEVVLEVLSEEGLFYLDSRTSADSVAYRLALELGVPAAERQVFLDVESEPAAIRAEFRRLLALARERGSAVAIGHPYPTTLQVLRREVPAALAAGYRFVPVSDLLDHRRAQLTGAQ